MTPDELEARSTVHARDRFSLRRLRSGRWAVYSNTYSLITIVSDITDVPSIPELSQERLRAEEAARRAAQEREVLLARAAQAKALASLELDLDDLEIAI